MSKNIRDYYRNLFEQVSLGSLSVDDAMKRMKPYSTRGRMAKEPSCKVTKNGQLAVYGFNHRPIVLFENNWLRLAEYMSNVTEFIEEHTSELKKPPSRETGEDSD